MKLTKSQVDEIFLSDKPTAALAQEYGVSTFTIRAIKRGRIHGDITGQYELLPTQPKTHRKILSDNLVRAIYEFSGTVRSLKLLFGVSKNVANNIKFGYTYKSITENLGVPGELRLHSLTWDDVCTIRASNLETKVLASLFGVSVGTINNIRSGRTRQFK